MAGFHHRETRKVLIVSGPVRIINSSILVTTEDDIPPDWEWNKLLDLPIEVCFKNSRDHMNNVFEKKQLFHYLRSLNEKGSQLWITRFSDGAPQNETT